MTKTFYIPLKATIEREGCIEAENLEDALHKVKVILATEDNQNGILDIDEPTAYYRRFADNCCHTDKRCCWIFR